MEKKYTDNELEKLWCNLSNISINEDEEIEESFLFFDKGTLREDIWKWFDEEYSKGVAYLMYNVR